MEILTQAEVAFRLGVSPRTVARLRAAGELAFLPGRPVRVRVAEVDRWILAQEARGKWLGKLHQQASAAVASQRSACAGQRPEFGNYGGQNAMMLQIARGRAVKVAGRRTGTKPKA
jgi:excisionase family DNA binding protein